MLRLVTGPVHSGKSRYLLECSRGALSLGKAVWYVVPEQLSYDTERRFIGCLGVAAANKIRIATFTKLCDYVFGATGGGRAPLIDDGTKSLIIMSAVRRNAKGLKYYGRFAGSVSFADSLRELFDELTRDGITAEDLRDAASRAGSDTLEKKAYDIVVLLAAYRAALSGNNYYDGGDLPARAAVRADRGGLFAGDVFFFDSFDGFTGSERKLIESIMRRAGDVFVSLPCDGGGETGLGVFDNARAEAEKLLRSAGKYGVPVAGTKVFSETDYGDISLRKLERALCEKDESVFAGETEAITVAETPNICEELDFVAFEIKRLVASENYRYKDFAIVARECDEYVGTLESVAKKYDIPVFFDKRYTLYDLPVCRLLISALQAAWRIGTDAVIGMLKCGLLPFDDDEIEQLENYCYVWRIDGRRWYDEWNCNPDGLSRKRDDADRRMARINDIRKKVLAVLRPLCENGDKTASGITEALYAFLTENGVPGALNRLTGALESAGEFETARCQITGYESLIDCFDRITRFDDGEIIDYGTYSRIFAALASHDTVGSVPQCLDSVMFCSSVHARVTDAKVVFMVGVNQGRQPKPARSGGLFSDAERDTLHVGGLNIHDRLVYESVDEKFKFYASACAASKRVYFSYTLLDAAMQSSGPSAVISQILGVFPRCARIKYSSARNNAFGYMYDKEPAFEKAVLQGNANTVESETARAFFYRDVDCREKAERAYGSGNFSLTVPAARMLYGSEIRLSASRVETFYKCPFRYFCNYGLQIRPAEKAEINELHRGTLIHRFLEKFFNGHKDDYASLSPSDISDEVERISGEYVVETGLGGDMMPAGFVKLFKNLRDDIVTMTVDIVEELKNSDFKPEACELRIGPGADIETIDIMIAGGRISLTGKIDRVDVAKINADSYVRVIDYKTGSKDFKISDILYGQNMQMLIYLGAVVKSRRCRPAGVLYKRFDAKDIGERYKPVMQSEGLVLNDPAVLEAMDRSGVYVPVVSKKGVRLDESTASGEDFENIFRHVTSMLEQMGNRLYAGDISVSPLKDGDRLACSYCEYKSVCLVEGDAYCRETEKRSAREVFKRIGEERANAV